MGADKRQSASDKNAELTSSKPVTALEPTKSLRPFGLWPSPLSPESLASGARLSDAAWDDDGQSLVWLESRGGRSILMLQELGAGLLEAPRALTESHDVRARVGYGGGDFCVGGGQVFFADAKSGRLFRQGLRDQRGAQAVTPAFGKAAAPQVTQDGKYLVYVHQDDAHTDRLAIVDAQGEAWPQVLAAGADFYAYPRFSPDGLLLTFVAWNHPDMPWDAAAVYLAPVEYPAQALPRLGLPRRIAGGDEGGRRHAAFQPQFSPDGSTLFYVCDESGWLHLHALDLRTNKTRIYPVGREAEHATPLWIQGVRTFAVSSDSRSVFLAVNLRGFTRLHRLDLESGEAELVDALSLYTDAAQLSTAVRGHKLAFIGSAATVSPRVIVYDDERRMAQVLARSTGETINEKDLSQPTPLTWRTTAEEDAHGIFYAPQNSKYTCKGQPPLMVIVHGGPTAQACAAYTAQAQFFTSRGYAVLYVNHRGSTGYGRAYMQKLRGAWGIVDVEDSVSGARYLAEQGKVDGQRMVIMGGSAGGYTCLQVLATYPEVFAAGISLYGISNLFKLNATTHKFERFYNDGLIGPLPEASEAFRQRSPLYQAARIKRPLAVFQGSDDAVVPQEQADLIVAAIAKHGVPHIYHVYEGEGHGFRKPETIRHLYSQIDEFLQEHVVFS